MRISDFLRLTFLLFNVGSRISCCDGAVCSTIRHRYLHSLSIATYCHFSCKGQTYVRPCKQCYLRRKRQVSWSKIGSAIGVSERSFGELIPCRQIMKGLYTFRVLVQNHVPRNIPTAHERKFWETRRIRHRKFLSRSRCVIELKECLHIKSSP